MTEDEQEALSFRYVMPRVMRLSSGKVVVMIDGQPPVFYNSWLHFADEGHIPSSNEIEAYHESLRASRPRAVMGPAKLTSIDLADFGL